jgi:hypothetical protein
MKEKKIPKMAYADESTEERDTGRPGGGGQCSFIILIYVMLWQPWRGDETKCAIAFS